MGKTHNSSFLKVVNCSDGSTSWFAQFSPRQISELIQIQIQCKLLVNLGEFWDDISVKAVRVTDWSLLSNKIFGLRRARVWFEYMYLEFQW